MEDQIIGVIVGAIVGFAGGLIQTRYSKYLEDKRSRSHATRAILGEVKANQEILNRLVERKKFMGERVKNQVLWKEAPEYGKTIYKSMGDKMGLFDSATSEKIIEYYGKIIYLEALKRTIFEYTLPITALLMKKEDDKNTEEKIVQTLKESSTKQFFEKAEETHTLGDELIRKLEKSLDY